MYCQLIHILSWVVVIVFAIAGFEVTVGKWTFTYDPWGRFDKKGR